MGIVATYTHGKCAPGKTRLKNRPGPTKITSGLNYYGYRYYDPTTGRWPSRDPMGERGGFNIYGFGPNTPINGWDVLGLDWSWRDIPLIGDVGGFLVDLAKGQDAVEKRNDKRSELFDVISDPECSSDELDEAQEEVDEAVDGANDAAKDLGVSGAGVGGTSMSGGPAGIPKTPVELGVKAAETVLRKEGSK